jgi:hypothetical protein
MIWRASRPTRYREDATLPYEVADGIVVGALDLAALRDLAIWRRLIQTSLPDVKLTTLLIAEAWTPKVKRSASAAFPPSEWAEISFVTDPERKWPAATEGETLFVALVRNEKVPLLILGAPTDEAWDRLEDAVKD